LIPESLAINSTPPKIPLVKIEVKKKTKKQRKSD